MIYKLIQYIGAVDFLSLKMWQLIVISITIFVRLNFIENQFQVQYL